MGFFSRSKKSEKGSTNKAQLLRPSPALPPPLPAPPPAGLLPPPPSWDGSANGQSAPTTVSYQQPPPPYGPVVVNQHYYFSPPPQLPFSQYPQNKNGSLARLNLGSTANVAENFHPQAGAPPRYVDGLPAWHHYGTQVLNQSAALYDQISSHFDHLMTSIDCSRFREKNPGLQYLPLPGPLPQTTDRDDVPPKKHRKHHRKDHPKGQTTAVASSVVSESHFAKVELYANSRLPMDLSRFKLYIPTYPLLCLAAQYSERVYETPRGAERDTFIDASWRTGSKAMVLKSVPMDNMNVIVFAIRGTATFMDWTVNLNMAPASPAGFLDDAGNLCHTGFLSVARRAVSPVARRLRQLLQENPDRSSYSLLITGHSAGGAVAALLYSHMLATSKEAESELNILTGCFRRIHCVTFGSPPVSVLPLSKPEDPLRPRLKKSLFLSFVNEGDPVVRADRAYVRSLFDLLAAPAPTTPAGHHDGADSSKSSRRSGSKARKAKPSRPSRPSSSTGKSKADREARSSPVWNVPPCTLSNAGRIVVLRSGDTKAKLKGRDAVEDRLNAGVVAQVTTDEQLRGVIWGDPVCHIMRLYSGRIETLAVGAVTAKGH